jgi:hypothetical protein
MSEQGLDGQDDVVFRFFMSDRRSLNALSMCEHSNGYQESSSDSTEVASQGAPAAGGTGESRMQVRV